MNHVRMGIIGLGIQGGYHVALFNEGKIKRASVTAVCDILPERLAPYAHLKTFTSSEEMIRSGEVDAVLIATPHYDHTTIGIDALQHGVHVLVEKPISVHVADAQRLIAAHTDPKVVFAAMFNQRTDPKYIKTKRLIASGEVGEIRRVQWTITDWFRPERLLRIGRLARHLAAAKAAACCSTSARTTWICSSGSAACRSRCWRSAGSASITTSRWRTR